MKILNFFINGFVYSTAKPVDEEKSKSFGRKAVSFVLITVTGGDVALVLLMTLLYIDKMWVFFVLHSELNHGWRLNSFLRESLLMIPKKFPPIHRGHVKFCVSTHDT